MTEQEIRRPPKRKPAAPLLAVLDEDGRVTGFAIIVGGQRKDVTDDVQQLCKAAAV